MTAGGYWREMARRWEKVGAPLRPSGPDLAAYQAVVDADRGRSVVMLGVTPEIYHLKWPPGTDIVALDHTIGMIDSVWAGPRGRALCADWRRMSLAPASRALAVCDGGLHLLSVPDGQAALVQNLARVLSPGGIFALRCFVPPLEPEPATAVIDELHAGKVANVNLLKLRLAMALQQDPRHGVELGRVWGALFGGGVDPVKLAGRAGWHPGEMSALDSYRDCPTRYHFVTLTEVEELFCRDPGGFEMVSVITPSYDLGERCPVVMLRRSLA